MTGYVSHIPRIYAVNISNTIYECNKNDIFLQEGNDVKNDKTQRSGFDF